jgi:hypothetical protein
MQGIRELKSNVDGWFNYSLFHITQALQDSLY